ncbi:MAG: hypothetical protein JWP01_1087 [Myxococcales bacterium]|nr:hypothetical protein [Myxococcales bacterium]
MLIRLFLVLVLAVSLSIGSTWNVPDAGAATIVIVDEEVAAPTELEEAVLSVEPAWISEHPQRGAPERTTARSPRAPHPGSVFRPPRNVGF